MPVIIRKTREIVGCLQKETGDLIIQGAEKVEVLNDVFASVFTGERSSHIAQATEGKSRDWNNSAHCRRRSGSRSSMKPKDVQVHGT